MKPRVRFVPKDGYPPELRERVSQNLDFLPGEFGHLIRRAGHVAARPSQTLGESDADKIGRDRHDDWDAVREPRRTNLWKRFDRVDRASMVG